MPPASGHVLNESTPMVDAVDPAAVSAAVGGRLKARSGVVVGGHQRDDLVQSDSDDSEMDRLYALQLGRNTSRCAIVQTILRRFDNLYFAKNGSIKSKIK